MGTPDIAVPCLEAVARWADGQVAVVTQPDRPKGRSSTPQPSPVKARAVELGLEVVQPERLRRNQEFADWLTTKAPDVVVVVAFGQILPAEVLATPRLGCVNVHFSLLPKYRGAAPVQWALLNGEGETGVATMLMDEGLDTGDILLTRVVTIDPQETAGDLLARLATLAPAVLSETLEELSAGRLISVPQDDSAASLAPRLAKEDGEIDWCQEATAIVNRVRGLTPWPGATALVCGERVKVLKAVVAEGTGEPGRLLAVADGRGLLVAAGDQAVWVERLQPPGRKAMRGEEYARGRHLVPDGPGGQRKAS